MKKMSTSDENMMDDLLPEYKFDYSKARPNRFAERVAKDSVVVVLDPDVAEVFKTPEAVNEVLRALITTMPELVKSSS
jgi:uncharacterized protein (DUF4415 family)